jgi:hypothetical protein
VVLAGGFDDAARARWVRRLLGEIAAREPKARCTLVRAVPDTLRSGTEKDSVPPASPASASTPASTSASTYLSPFTLPFALSPFTQFAQPAQLTQSTQPTQLTLLERRPPCLCCPDAGLVDELTRLASPLAARLAAPLASPLASPRPACAWLIVELPVATLVWTREELRRTLPAPVARLFTVMVRRPSAANNTAGAALWNLPGLADFEVFDAQTAETVASAIVQSGG